MGSMDTVSAFRKRFSRVSAMCAVIVALFWPFLFRHASHDLTDTRVILRSICAGWGVAVLLALVAFGMLRRRPAWYGIRMCRWRDVVAMVAAMAALLLVAAAVKWLFSVPFLPDYQRKLGTTPLPLRSLLVLTAGATEEFMYRGFALEELAALIGKRRLAALLSMACFTLAHTLRVGLSPALLLVGCAAAALTILYLWRRNLPACMLMHIIIDGIGLIIVPMAYRAQ